MSVQNMTILAIAKEIMVLATNYAKCFEDSIKRVLRRPKALKGIRRPLLNILMSFITSPELTQEVRAPLVNKINRQGGIL